MHSAASIIVIAMTIRDGRSENLYYQNALARYQLVILSTVLLLLLVAGILIVTAHDELVLNFLRAHDSEEPPPITEIPLSHVGIALFGAMGATVSAIMSFAATKTQDRIPESTATTLVTFSRPFVGAVSAIVVVYAFQSGLIARPDVNWPAVVWVIAFASGFSERLVVRTIEATAKT